MLAEADIVDDDFLRAIVGNVLGVTAWDSYLDPGQVVGLLDARTAARFAQLCELAAAGEPSPTSTPPPGAPTSPSPISPPARPEPTPAPRGITQGGPHGHLSRHRRRGTRSPSSSTSATSSRAHSHRSRASACANSASSARTR